MCMDYAAVPAQHFRGVPFIGAGTPYYAGPGGNLGAFMAWDASTGKMVWEDKEHFPNWSGRIGHRRRRGVLRHARRLVQVGGRQDRQAALQVQGRLGRRGQPDHLSVVPTANSMWRSTPASAETGSCSRETSAPTIQPMCARRPIHTRTSGGIPARAASSGSSGSEGGGTPCQPSDASPR